MLAIETKTRSCRLTVIPVPTKTSMHDTVIKVVQAAKWALRVHYGKCILGVSLDNNEAFECSKHKKKSSVIWGARWGVLSVGE